MERAYPPPAVVGAAGGPEVVVADLAPAHWAAVRGIYEEGIATGVATFEVAAPAWEEWDAAHLPVPRLVALAGPGRTVTGWAAVSPVSDRCAYGGVGEVSVYVRAAARGAGVGRLLLSQLVGGSEAAGLWTLQAGVIASNAASIALHRSCGFRIVGTRHRLGQLHGRWHDVVLLERRSPVVG